MSRPVALSFLTLAQLLTWLVTGPISYGKAPIGRTMENREDGAIVKGNVSYDGILPDPGTITTRPDFKESKDRDYALKGDTTGQTWKVGAGKGVANVVVWLTPPAGISFPMPQKKWWPDEVVLDQPYCTFEPHVLVYFPRDRNGKSSGQRFVIKNSASIAHNVKWFGGADNPGDNRLLTPGRSMLAEMQPSGRPITFQSDIHKWMSAHCWVLDHPYFAVTDKDGNFAIKHVPAGIKLHLVAWHEGANLNPASPVNRHFVLPEREGSRGGQALGALRDAEMRTINFKIK